MILVLEWKEASENFCSGWLFKMLRQKSGVFWQQNYKSWRHTTTLPVYSSCAGAVLNPQHLFSLNWEAIS
jgi:hypothetical protein